MNFLAHMYLARPNPVLMVGNLLGDFIKPRQLEGLHPKLVLGYQQHQAVDRFCDHHPEITALKPLFSDKRRRFAAIALDIYFDHLLIRHWSELTHGSARDFQLSCYQAMVKVAPMLPKPVGQRLNAIAAQDWFSHYGDAKGIGLTLDRVAMRIRNGDRFVGAYEELNRHQDQISSAFLRFFPQLQNHFHSLHQ